MGGDSLGGLAVGGQHVIGNNGGLHLRDVGLAVGVVLEGIEVLKVQAGLADRALEAGRMPRAIQSLDTLGEVHGLGAPLTLGRHANNSVC